MVRRLQDFRRNLSQWEQETNDLGRFSETGDMYDSDMQPYVEKVRRKQPETAGILERNIALMKKWRQEGK